MSGGFSLLALHRREQEKENQEKQYRAHILKKARALLQTILACGRDANELVSTVPVPSSPNIVCSGRYSQPDVDTRKRTSIPVSTISVWRTQYQTCTSDGKLYGGRAITKKMWMFLASHPMKSPFAPLNLVPARMVFVPHCISEPHRSSLATWMASLKQNSNRRPPTPIKKPRIQSIYSIVILTLLSLFLLAGKCLWYVDQI